jgi:uncharacterized protein (DUF2252 family)
MDMHVDPIDLVAQVNRGRVPALLQRKFTAMAADPFAFLRATAGLGHRAVDRAALPAQPLAWLCGDLHVQNFGCFRGANGLVYFDLNDFDEAGRLPASLDILRLLASVHVAAAHLGLGEGEDAQVARAALDAYAGALARGKAFWLERDTAAGPARRLLRQVERRARRDLLASRTHGRGAARRLNLDGVRYLALGRATALRGRLQAAVAELGAHFSAPEYFAVQDLAFRVAGMGSLGVSRYVALTQGEGGGHGQALIDLKFAVPSAAVMACPDLAQPVWSSEAARVIAVQDLCQAASPAFLSVVAVGARLFIARELQPVEDKMPIEVLAHAPRRLAHALADMGRLAAWAQLRAAGRQGAAPGEELVAFGAGMQAHPEPWLDAARAVADTNAREHRLFAHAWTAGDPRLHALVEPLGGAASATPAVAGKSQASDAAAASKAARAPLATGARRAA